ncbi:hypothetical protein BDZ85DRAFT_132805 [Elsinoe ampelina]|uniref:Secreted protein n=1 Tax=Elsinoe ampelina TaxID=302913 RepID=A0A6A6G7T7_9PEZI|nr:hypothetical protein BDZ85DRAFT_132805 [Elsinoe ampelina]
MRPCSFFSAACLMAWHVCPFDSTTACDTAAVRNGHAGSLFSCPMLMCTLPLLLWFQFHQALNADAANSRSVVRNNIRSSFWGYQSE